MSSAGAYGEEAERTQSSEAATAPSRLPGPLPRGFPRRFPVRDDGRRPWRYRICAVICRVFLRSLLRGGRLRLEGRDTIPTGGPLIIACNHLSNLDPMLVGGFCTGTNFAMAKRELYANPVLAWIWGGCNTFPVDRGTADRRALRTADEVLRGGGRLILWVEGTRAERPGMKRAEPGVGFILRRHPCPVLPVAVTGSEAALVRGRRLPRRVPITLRFGTPVTLDIAGHDNQGVADLVGAQVAALLPPGYRGIYAQAGEEVLSRARTVPAYPPR